MRRCMGEPGWSRRPQPRHVCLGEELRPHPVGQALSHGCVALGTNWIWWLKPSKQAFVLCSLKQESDLVKHVGLESIRLLISGIPQPSSVRPEPVEG
jgi:hypothetical protein